MTTLIKTNNLKKDSEISNVAAQSNSQVVAESPAVAMANTYQSISHSNGILFQDSVAQRRDQRDQAQAAAYRGVLQLYVLDTVTVAGAALKMFRDVGITPDTSSKSVEDTVALLAALKKS